MRKKEISGSLSVHAVSGTYVVLLGINMAKPRIPGLLGFAIERIDHTEDERYWLKGFKTFEETNPGLLPGSLISTLEHPVQAFLWSDFTAKPAHNYTYRIVAMRGKPKKLEQSDTVEVQIATEVEDIGSHAVYFNRGVAGSQAYTRKFGNKPPDEVPNDKAWQWLSRGLLEGLLTFIGQATGAKYALRGAVYEFQYQPVLEAFAAARDSGVDVKIIFDARKNSKDYPNKENRKTIQAVGIQDLTVPRTTNPSYIAHNKFIVLLKDNKPIQVWTGSTNVTDGGIFGHSNVGHLVRDPAIASSYLTYWEELNKDPEAKVLRLWTEKMTPIPKSHPVKNLITPIFSPRTTLEALEWYVAQMDAAEGAVFFTAAFGVNKLIAEVLRKDKDYLRYILLEKEDKDMQSLRRDQDNQFAVGGIKKDNALEHWLKEKLTGLNTHVKYIHTKYMLIDPLGDEPLVITGSANFSDSSTKKNDENMLVIHGDKQVADIYLGEFMRLFNHFYFRYVTEPKSASGARSGKLYLKSNDSWCEGYYDGSSKQKERIYFAG